MPGKHKGRADITRQTGKREKPNDKDGDVAEIEKEGAENEEGKPQQSFPNEASGTQQIKNLKEMQS